MLRALTSNLHWKALALLLSLLLWYAVVGEPELVTTHSAPVFFKNLPRDLEIGSDVPDRVHLEIRGPAGKLHPNNLADTAILVDLANVHSPGERTFTVTDGSISLPNGVTLLRSVPSQLRLRFEKMAVKEIPVQVRSGAAPPTGYGITEQSVAPATIRVVGPESRVQLQEAAQTDPIDLHSTIGKAEFRVHAYLSDPQVRFEGSPIVKVNVVVEKKGQ